jgi:hypothetical protein
MKTILFLDLDGPCHPAQSVILGADGRVYGDRAFCWLEPLLQLLDEMPHVQVVVHSSWRMVWGEDDELKARLPPALAARVVGVTTRDCAGRYPSIEAYCAEHQPERFAIVDDEPAAFPEGLEQLVPCGALGLSDPATLEALRRALA